MKNLIRYIDEKNRFRALFNRPLLPLNPFELTAQDKQELRLALECDMSPENMCCDGELSGHALRNKVHKINGAYAELGRIK